MNDLLWVHVGNPLGNLSSDDWGGLLFELAFHQQILEKMTFCAQLHEKIDPCFVVEEIIESWIILGWWRYDWILISQKSCSFIFYWLEMSSPSISFFSMTFRTPMKLVLLCLNKRWCYTERKTYPDFPLPVNLII